MPSGVKTPQLDVQAYQPMEAPPPPVPEMQTNNPLPTSAGYVSKAGAGAFIASNIINGYLKGRQHAAEVKQQKATQQIQGADYTYKAMAENYNNLLRSGKNETDPEVQKAKAAAGEAWQASLSVKAQYVMPQDDGKKKGVKQKTEGILKGVFGKEGIQPHVIPAAALAALKTSPPPGLGLSLDDKREMAQTEAAQFEVGEAKKQAKRADEQYGWLKSDHDRDQHFTALASAPPGTLSLAQSQELSQLTRLEALKKDPIHGAQDYDLSQKILSGAHMNQGEMQTAVARGLLQGPHVEQRTNGKGMDELVAYDPTTGAIVSRTSLGKHFVDNTALTNAIAIARFQQKQQFDEIKKALGPDATDAKVYQIMGMENSKHPEFMAAMIGDNPVQKSKDIQAVNLALKAVWAEYQDPNTTRSKDPKLVRERQLVENFISTPNVNDATGTYAFKPEISSTGTKMTHWHLFGPNETEKTYAGNATPQELQSTAAALYNRTRQALAAQGKGKYTEADLDRMLPPKYKDLSGYGMNVNGPLEAPPGGGEKKAKGYNVTINGQTNFYPADGLDETKIAQATAMGAKFEPQY